MYDVKGLNKLNKISQTQFYVVNCSNERSIIFCILACAVRPPLLYSLFVFWFFVCMYVWLYGWMYVITTTTNKDTSAAIATTEHTRTLVYIYEFVVYILIY